jgi:ribokinase
VMGDRLLMFPGGKGANQAVAAARLGAEVVMVGRVGNDGFAERLLTELKNGGVDAAGVARDSQQPTGSALIIVDTKGRNQIAVAPGANNTVGEEELERLAPLLDRNSVLLLQMEIPAPAVHDAMLLARQQGARVIFNAAPPNNVKPNLLRELDTLVMNKNEAGAVLGIPVMSAGTARRAALRARQMGTQSVIVTMGSAGSVLCTGDKVVDVDVFPVHSVDTTGAGDAFMGALGAALSRGKDLSAATKLASAAGAFATLKQGAQSSLPEPADLKQLFGIDWY